MLAYVVQDSFCDACVDDCLVLGKLLDLVVEVVAVKQRLDRLSTQLQEILFELFVLKIPPFFVDVLLVEVVFHRGHKRCLKLFLIEVVPWEVPQPWVVLYFVSPVNPQAVLWFALDHLQS